MVVIAMKFIVVLVQLIAGANGIAWFSGNAWIRDASNKLFGRNDTITRNLPSLADIYDHVLSIYTYLNSNCEDNRHEYREIEERSIHFVSSCFVPSSGSADGLSSTIEEATKMGCKYQSLHGSEFWDYLGHEKDILVWRLKKHIDVRKENVVWPCLKSHTTIDLPPEQLANLLMDSDKIQLLNKYSAGRIDVEIISPTTKIVWNRTRVPYAIKPYDFCTLMHLTRDANDDKCIVILSKSVVHDSVPESDEFSRSEIIFGMNILRPSKNDNSMTDLTSINHVKYKGIPPFFVSRSALPGTVGYLKRLKEVAQSIKK